MSAVAGKCGRRVAKVAGVVVGGRAVALTDRAPAAGSAGGGGGGFFVVGSVAGKAGGRLAALRCGDALLAAATRLQPRLQLQLQLKTRL